MIALLIFLSPLILMYIAYQFHLFKEGKAFYFNRIKWGTKINRKRYLEIDAILEKRISFYTHLSSNGKAKFINRLCHLMRIKKFVSRNKLIITEEINWVE